MKLVAHGINRIAMVVFNLLIVCSLIGAVALIPADVAQASRLGLAIVILAGIGIWILATLERQRPGLLADWLVSHTKLVWLIGGLAGIGIVAWQLMLVRSLSGNFGWDPGALMYGAIVPDGHHWMQGRLYFSHYPNNLTLLYIYRGLAKLFGLTKLTQIIVAANYLNVVMIDFAGLALTRIVWQLKVSRNAVILAGGLYVLLVMVWPYVVIPYSDTWAILIGSLLMLVYTSVTSQRGQGRPAYLGILTLGILLAFAYLIKPSTVIFAVAVGVVLLPSHIDRNFKKVLMILFVAGCGFLIPSVAVHEIQAHVPVVQVNHRLAYPFSHFIAMGLVGNGSFNPSQVEKNTDIRNPRKRNQYNWYLATKEVGHYVQHPGDGLKFFFAKQIANTSEGTFGWGYEGGFLKEPFNRNHLNLIERWQQRHFIDLTGQATTNMAGLNLIAQLLWTITLASLLLKGIELEPKNLTLQIFKYTILGGMVFLLIFEGGRSRYMMQFLPYVLVIVAVNLTNWYQGWVIRKHNQKNMIN